MRYRLVEMAVLGTTILVPNGLSQQSVISTIADGKAHYTTQNVAADRAGRNIYFSDGVGAIYKIDLSLPTPNARKAVGGGSCTSPNLGDGGKPLNACLSSPNGVAVNDSGALFIADTDHHRIRKVEWTPANPDGIITTVAGKGACQVLKPADLGDGGAATSACLNNPLGVTVDKNGVLYLTDGYNFRIRKVTWQPGTGLGIIQTVAGKCGQITPGGTCNTVPGGNGDKGNPADAQLGSLSGLGVDRNGENLYFVDTNRIRWVSLTTNRIDTVAGAFPGQSGYAGDHGPAIQASFLNIHDVAVDDLGNYYISDHSNHRIRRVDHVTHVVETVAGKGYVPGTSYVTGDGGSPTDATVGCPEGVGTDSLGNLYIAQCAAVVRKVTNASAPAPPASVDVTIATNPPGLVISVDSAAYTAPQTFHWTPGKPHLIAPVDPQFAPAGAQYAFVNWSDGGAEVRVLNTPASDTTLTVSFKLQYRLSRLVNPDGTGTLTPNPSSVIDYFDAGSAVELTAAATAGYAFNSYSGDLTGSKNQQTITMSGNKIVTANFAPAVAVGITTTLGTFDIVTGHNCPPSSEPFLSD